MKKGMFLGLVLGCGALLLTGCGGSGAHTLKCTQKGDGMNMEMTLHYNSDDTKIEKIEITQEMELPEGTSETDAATYKTAFEEQCAQTGLKCTAKVKGNTIVIDYSGTPSDVGYDAIESKTMDEVKEQAKDSGLTCE